MYSRKPRIRLWPLVMAAVMVLGSLVGVALAKYVYSTELHATVTFSARLADNLWLQEHAVERQTDGSYVLTSTVLPVLDDDGNVTDNQNDYILMPGVDVPKDPYITIDGKTPLEAYLFVEVVDSLDSDNTKVTYEMEPHWLDITNQVTPEHGGRVYVYAKDSVAVKVTADVDELGILKGDTVYVSQKLDKNATDLELKFYAALGEIAVVTEGNVTRERTPAEVYWDVYHNPDINT